MCNNGQFQKAGGATACDDCLAGHYCPQGAAAALPCFAGTYSTATNLANPTQCTDCPLGQFCVSAATAPSDCGVANFAGKKAQSLCDVRGSGSILRPLGCASPYPLPRVPMVTPGHRRAARRAPIRTSWAKARARVRGRPSNLWGVHQRCTAALPTRQFTCVARVARRLSIWLLLPRRFGGTHPRVMRSGHVRRRRLHEQGRLRAVQDRPLVRGRRRAAVHLPGWHRRRTQSHGCGACSVRKMPRGRLPEPRGQDELREVRLRSERDTFSRSPLVSML